MTRVTRRLRALARHAIGFRGLLIGLATASAIAAILLPDLRVLFACVSVVLAALILLLASVRQAEMTEAMQRLQRQARSARDPHVLQQRARSEVKRARYGPETSDAREIQMSIRHLESARQALALTALNLRTEPQPSLENDGIPRLGPAVTVVVPCHNEARFLMDCLESIRRQSFTDWECIVVDDASSDESLRIVHGMVDGDARFRVARHATNSGLPAARNTGLRLARGSLVAFVDADDMLYSESLMDRVDALSAAGPDELIVGSYSGVEIGGVESTVDELETAEDWIAPSLFIDFLNGSDDCPFPVLAPLVRLEAVLAAGGFDESIDAGGEDWELWQRLLRAGFVFIPSALRSALYRQRPDSMTKRLAADHVRQSAVLIDLPYRSMSDGLATATRAPFPEPIDAYKRMLLVSRRAIRFGAMALVSGDLEQYMACIDELEPSSWPWLSRHLDIRVVARDGIRRALGLKSSQVDEILRHTRVFEDRIVNDVTSQTTSISKAPEVVPGPLVDYLLAPQNRAQLNAMVAALPSDNLDSVGVLLLDRLTGEQGVSEGVRNIASTWSLNEWLINRGRCRTLVVGSVRDGAVSALVDAILDSGGSVIEVEEPGAELMLVPESRRDEVEHRVGVSERLTPVADLEPFAFTDDLGAPGSEWDSALASSPEGAWQLEEKGDLPFDADAIRQFENKHEGERVVIIGNGPSLNQLDLSLLADVPTIAVNAIFLASDRMGFDPTYYVVEDTAVMRDNLDQIKEYKAGHRFFPSIYRDQIGKAPNTSYFRMNTGFYEGRSPAFCVPRFSTDASQRMYSGQSVTIINLQLAYYMGFSEVILIGMDFSYSIPESSIVEGNRILSQGDDPNHFHPDYFGKGKVWKDPKLDRVLANYQLAKLMFEADGRRIVNATHGGKLELFDRVDYRRAIEQAGAIRGQT